VHPDLGTMVALERLSEVWGVSLGMAVTFVLDTWAEQSVVEALDLQQCVGRVRPEWAGKPLTSLPRDVFLAGCQRQDLENLTPEGHA